MYFGWIPLEIPHYGLVDAQLWYEHLLFIYYTCGRIRYTTFVCSSPKPEMLEIACPFPFGAHMFAMDDNYSGPFTIAKFLTSQALMEARVFALPLSHSAIVMEVKQQKHVDLPIGPPIKEQFEMDQGRSFSTLLFEEESIPGSYRGLGPRKRKTCTFYVPST
ncbi:hypothetical protein M9H77_14376 [Catharanthus roseus]|uniref:Uncharacterized protein n=1 Tax=Catharanthus roseus TaxID=4058 RepID=A0ACC0BN28_CATRO|nr:hypothetical protein M9H77_14376 [Catharanthus roseus]